jgi:predicted Zn-dependent protease
MIAADMNIGIDPDLQEEKGDDTLEVVQEVEIGHILGIEGHVLGSTDIEDIDPETVDIKFYFFLLL